MTDGSVPSNCFADVSLRRSVYLHSSRPVPMLISDTAGELGQGGNGQILDW